MSSLAAVVVTVLTVSMRGPDPSGADENNADVEACQGKQAKDACQRLVVGKSASGEVEKRREPGVCATDRCCTLDYSKGSPPQSVCDTCLVCKPGAPTSDPPAADEGAGADDAAHAEPPRVGGEPQPPPTPSSGRGCRVGEPSSATWAAGIWGLVVARRSANRARARARARRT